MSNEQDHPYPPHLRLEQQSTRLAIGMLAAPVAWLVHLIVSFAVVESSCAMRAPWVLHTALVVGALLLAIPGGVLSFNALRAASNPAAADDNRSGHPSAENDQPTVHVRSTRTAQRNRLFAAAALANSVFFSTIIVLSWTASLVVSPCTP